MSPPCQPFSTTNEAKQLGLQDKRCAALDHLCATITKLTEPPRWIALENVKGFYGSDACEKWQNALTSAGYTWRPFLLDLASFGVPNHRTRYYLLAERSQRFASHVEAAANGTAREKREAPAASCSLPPGVLATGKWVQQLRRRADEVHALAREMAAPADREDAFKQLRAEFCSALQSLRGAAGQRAQDAPKQTGEVGGSGGYSCSATQAPEAQHAGGDLYLAGTAAWKLIPLPRDRDDALLVVFDTDQFAPQRLLHELMLLHKHDDVNWSLSDGGGPSTQCIGDYLEDLTEEELNELIVPQITLEKPFARGLSYVDKLGVTTFCFTGHYGKVMHKASGSLLFAPESPSVVNKDDPASMYGSVRFFSPKEVINMLGFPADFKLPLGMRLLHRYKIVGNSIGVTVCIELLRYLLFNESAERLTQLEQPPPSRQILGREKVLRDAACS
eukprot:TRINITY_DN11669_c0_g1_i3.p1 TRINITY_DN11669_c0_g1~~TRINITY_DN11669_c0_g1_i3.p1  ORF type:complete len:446 (-),score=87.67 TRINITY_DN11669_c0_g1_i3:378-1715(-)